MVLVNPNTSTATTAMMTTIARRSLDTTPSPPAPATCSHPVHAPAARTHPVHAPAARTHPTHAPAACAHPVHAPAALAVRGVTVSRGPGMLTDPAALRAAAPEVLAAGLRAVAEGDCAALLVAAFGDPGVEELRAATEVPVVGLGEAALAEAAADGTPFGIATTTPLLADAITERVAALGLADRYTGLRLTAGAPERLSADPALLLDRLERAVRACAERDGARAVVIGGGPLGEAADELRARCAIPVVAPIPAAIRAITRMLTA
ncbi:aspartate/glutamate racemase family protein [Streptomyces wedmorensis]|uniref:aspartate/glutamate racemase family protein n=1 Tax=Streptomyces wedmorensis TaxID=43759 RepID=UPI0037956E04